MKRGLYRLSDPILGEAARVHKSAGDAAPYLSRNLYELLEFEPAFDSLPTMREHKRAARAPSARPRGDGAPLQPQIA